MRRSLAEAHTADARAPLVVGYPDSAVADRMPARSDAGSSEASVEGDTPSIAQLVERLQKKLSGDASGALSLSAHQSAARTISKLRGALLLAGPEDLPPKLRVALLCVGVNMHRRASGSLRRAQDDEGTEEVETEDSLVVQALLRRTSACMMLLCSIAEWNAERREVLSNALALMNDRKAVALATTMLAKPPLKRDAAPEEREESERRIEQWRRAIASQSNPPHVARAAMRCCLYEASEGADAHAAQGSIEAVTSAGQTERAWKRLEDLAPVFFRASADAMAQKWLLPDGDRDFVSLEAAPIARYDEATRTRKLRSIAQSAESEAGQSVARALMLGFLLPTSVVGTRRTLLLSREANTKATLDHPQEVERAHNVAYALRILTSNHTRTFTNASRAQDGGHRVDLRQGRGRPRARHLDPRGRGDAHDARQGGGGAQGRRVRRPVAASVLRDAAAVGFFRAAHRVRAAPAAMGAVPHQQGGQTRDRRVAVRV